MEAQVVQGDTLQMKITAKNIQTGEVIDLTDTTLIYEVASCVGGDPVITKSLGSGITMINAQAGIFTVDLTSEDTNALSGRYYQEVQITDLAGRITSLGKQDFSPGTLFVRADIIQNLEA